MPSKKQTKASRYPSPSSPGVFVTAAQYIAELVCHKKAKANKTNLPIQFWKLDGWKEYFLYQLRLANQILKYYNEKAVIRALEDKRSYNTFSLKSPRLVPIFKEMQRQIELEQKTIVSVPVKEYNPIGKIRSTPSKRSLFDKLKEIDNGKEKS